MFRPDTAKINIRRNEPCLDKPLDMIKRRIESRNESVAARTVIKDLIKKKPKNVKKSREKILKEWEIATRSDSVKHFVELWNKWGSYYRKDFRCWWPKRSEELTCAENILELVKKKDISLDFFIGSCFKAYQHKRFIPNVQIALANGIDYFNQFVEEVEYDLSSDLYEYGDYD